MALTEAKENTREAIESKLKTIGGDMLKLEYLENILKSNQTFDIKKFSHMKLADIYEKRLMLGEAAKNIDAAAEISPTFKEKIDLYKKSIEINVKHGSYDVAENSLKKAITNASIQEKEQLKKHFKDICLKRASELEAMQRNNNAIKIYERLLPLSFVSDAEKQQINSKLAVLYRKVGKIVESMRLGG
jgi:tetratricopeptide (TPR) repeat protein